MTSPTDVLVGDTLIGDSVSSNPHTSRGIGGDDILTGNAGNDMLIGNAGGDVIDGMDGDDTINGGEGHDDLTGGAGNDTFVFSPLDGVGDDKIVDFRGADNNEADRIDLTAFKINERVLDDIIEDNLSVRGESVIVDLTGIGGGLISLQSNTPEGAVALLTDLQGTGGDDYFIIA